MNPEESQTEKHTRLAEKLMRDASREIAEGELVQGSEKLWGAASQALKAYCASRGIPHGKYAQRRHAALELSDEREDDSIRLAFKLAESCHANFYNDWMEQEDLDSHVADIRTFVEKILDARAA
ncbi:MAG: hypothetical protein F4X64_01560 [Chloroflexi bacterium]|nr:hypothetical protein [Chloroflexota bacterium]